MCRRLKPKPPTTQPWRNLQHSPPDSNQPASEEFGTVQLDLVTAFKQAGAVVLAARSLAEASRLVEHDGLSAAIVDVGLGDHDASPLCARLEQRHIPLILHTGYSHHGPVCRSGIVVRKPASPGTLIQTVAGLLR
jgi:DNA-binding response OmpR family regulator